MASKKKTESTVQAPENNHKAPEILGAKKDKSDDFGKPGTVQLISVSEISGKRYTISAIPIPSMGVIVNTLIESLNTPVSSSVFVPKGSISTDDDGNPVLWDMHAGNMVMR